MAGSVEAGEERALVDEDARLVASDDVEREEGRIEEARRAGRRHHGPGVDRLDVTHRPRQLALDLGIDEMAHRGVVHLVHHRVPDRPAVLQPVEVDGAVPGEGGQVSRSTVVLIDEPARAVADHERRVAAGAVGDRRLDVDRHRQLAVVTTESMLLAVDRADQVVEAEGAQPPVEFAAGVAGDEDSDVSTYVALVGEPRLVEVIAMEVRDVQVVGVADLLVQLVAEPVVAREHEPRPEEGRYEPWVAHDRPVGRLDEDAGLAERRGAQLRQATGGSVYCCPPRETCSVHAEPSQ